MSDLLKKNLTSDSTGVHAKSLMFKAYSEIALCTVRKLTLSDLPDSIVRTVDIGK